VNFCALNFTAFAFWIGKNSAINHKIGKKKTILNMIVNKNIPVVYKCMFTPCSQSAANINSFPLRSKVKMAMCKQHKTRRACESLAVCSGFMLFAAHQYLRV
jgi:hypothetical protein